MLDETRSHQRPHVYMSTAIYFSIVLQTPLAIPPGMDLLPRSIRVGESRPWGGLIVAGENPSAARLRPLAGRKSFGQTVILARITPITAPSDG